MNRNASDRKKLTTKCFNLARVRGWALVATEAAGRQLARGGRRSSKRAQHRHPQCTDADTHYHPAEGSLESCLCGATTEEALPGQQTQGSSKIGS